MLKSQYEIRWHGRGGQGVVTAAQIITAASIFKGFFAMTFPEFGPERRGAPVVAYTRIGLRRIYHREPILNHDYIVILDPSLLSDPSVFNGIKSDSIIIVNYPREPTMLSPIRSKVNKVLYVDAVGVALKTLGRPIVNTAIIGALLRVFNLLTIDDVKRTLEEFFHGNLLKSNIDALVKAYEETRVWGGE